MNKKPIFGNTKKNTLVSIIIHKDKPISYFGSHEDLVAMLNGDITDITTQLKYMKNNKKDILKPKWHTVDIVRYKFDEDVFFLS